MLRALRFSQVLGRAKCGSSFDSSYGVVPGGIDYRRRSHPLEGARPIAPDLSAAPWSVASEFVTNAAV